MNKLAVALAADSAVTIGSKIYNTEDKLFILSSHYPVGIMVYGNAAFMDIPWEVIIKTYSKKLGRKSFPFLEGYADDFIKYIESNIRFFPEKHQKDIFSKYTQEYFIKILIDIMNEFEDILSSKKSIKYSEIKDIIKIIIDEHHADWKNADLLPSISKKHAASITKKLIKTIEEIISGVFQKFPLSKDSIKQLESLAGYYFSKDIFSDNYSGVVIAGFGEKEKFPTMVSYKLDAIVNKKLKYEKVSVENINFHNTAYLGSFAQSEMVQRFMDGIDSELRDFCDQYILEVLDKYSENIISKLSLKTKDNKRLLKRLESFNEKIFKTYLNEVDEFIRDKNADPILDAIAVLPKDELAAMAEALVNLTSFKRRITMDTSETVGGPIDVAIISKGDGFIWIKKKHYFDPNLNKQIFKFF